MKFFLIANKKLYGKFKIEKGKRKFFLFYKILIFNFLIMPMTHILVLSFCIFHFSFKKFFKMRNDIQSL